MDTRGQLPMQVMAEYFELWREIQDMLLLSDEDDCFEWRLTVNRKYTASSAYHAFSLALSRWTIQGTCGETLCR